MYIENQCETPRRKTVPRNRSYPSTTDYGKKVCVVGDGHIKRNNRKRFNNSSENAKFFIKSFPGAKIQKLENYLVSHLHAQKLDVSVIHIQDNNINVYGINDVNVKKIPDNIINIGKKCANFGSEVFISSILINRNIRLNLVIRKMNDELQELRKKYKLNYIPNDVIGRSFLCERWCLSLG